MRGFLTSLAFASLLAAGCGEDNPMGDGGGGDMVGAGGDAAGDAKPGGDGGGDASGVQDGGGGDAVVTGDGGSDMAVLVVLDGVSPAAASRAQAAQLSLTGAGFATGAKVTLTSCDGNMTKIDLGVATVSMNGALATVTLPADSQRPQGYYSVTITNPDGSTATLPCAFLVSALPPPTVTAVQPGSAWQGAKNDNVLSDQAVTVTGTNFLATPGVQLRNRMTGAVYQANSVSFVSSTTLTAVVPSESQQMAVGDYDFIVVNPNLLSAEWANPFKVTATPPPVIAAIAPVSTGACPVTITLTGSGFQMGMTAVFIVPPATNCAGGVAGMDSLGRNTCSITVASVAMNGNSATLTVPQCLALGLYPIEVTNPDGQYSTFQSFEFTPNSGGHFNGGTAWEVGPPAGGLWPQLVTARWRHGFEYGFDEFGDTLLYVVGGQAGATSAPLASVEIAQVDVFGQPGAWATAQQFKDAMNPRVDDTLGGLGAPQGRTGLELLRFGRWLYALGGANVNTNDQAVYNAVVNNGDKGILRTVERAEILGYETMPIAQKPSWTPGNGLPIGTWYYRVSGVSANGESLPSSAVIATNGQGVIHLTWSKPPSGAPGSYNIYRSLASDGRANTERLLATGVVGQSFDDTGAMALTPAPGRLQGTIAQNGTLVNGTYSYRVSACVGGTCDDNDRSNETLAGYAADVVVDGTAGRTVALTWNPLPNVKYRLFKLNANTKRYEQIAKDITDGQKPFLDDGSIAFPQNPILPKDGIAPLPIGSISTWTTLPKQMVRAREGLDGVTLHLVGGGGALYVGGGRSTTAANQNYLTTLEDALVDANTGDLSDWKEQVHKLSSPRAFFALLTTQDRDITPTPPPPQQPPCPDFDNDGYVACWCYTGMDMACGTTACDCNDNDPGIHPCANDICGNGIAENCVADLPCPMGCNMMDVDGDGHNQFVCGGDDCCDTGNEGMAWDPNKKQPGTLGCSVQNAKSIHPGAIEVCGDGIDQNCDGVDPPCPMNCNDDKDGDGYIACTCFPNGPPGTVTCTVDGQQVTIGKCDCNDNDPKTYPCAPDLTPCDGTAENCIADECVPGVPPPGADPQPGEQAQARQSTWTAAYHAPAFSSPLPRWGGGGMFDANAAPTEWLVAAGGGSLDAASANGQQNGNALASMEACAVDTGTGDLVRCDLANTPTAPWALQAPNLQHANLGLDGVLYAAGASPFLMVWPGSHAEVLGGAPTPDNGTASRFDVDATADQNGVMTADPAKVVNNFQSNSSKFTIRTYYKMVRVDSYVYVVGGWEVNGATGTIERHQQ